MTKISACLLNWKRPDNLRANLDQLARNPLVDEAIVWNNNAGEPFAHEWATVINSSADLGLHTRFATAALARNPAVLIFDDDLALPDDTIAALYDRWLDDPQIVHGIFGRQRDYYGAYRGGDVYGDVPIVLTRALIFHRQYAPAWLSAAQHFDDLFRWATPFGNGEDILLSYVARRASGRLNRAYDLPRRELPAGPPGVAIHTRGWTAHLDHRTRLCLALDAWLQEAPP